MSHVVFFSYARKDSDRFLENFFKDLCTEIATYTDFTPEDDRISFRDKSDLPLMENWRTNIVDALQTSAVMVCITSTKYFNREFCGKEFYFFNNRRRQGLVANQPSPPVMLPVIWLPADHLPEVIDEVQQVPKDITDDYRKRGLRDIARFDPAIYDRCVSAFAASIVDAWKKYAKKIKPLDKMPEFDDIPNAFAGGKWEEAVGPDGAYLSGPETANFVFVAESKEDCPNPEGRYGTNGSEWRPYFPNEPKTVLEHVTDALKKQFRFREIRVNEDLPAELQRAHIRKNLSILIGEPKALPLETFKEALAIEKEWWDGCAVLLPCHEALATCEDQEAAFRKALPVLSQSPSKMVCRPRSPAELQDALDKVLFEMRTTVTQKEIAGKVKTEPPPPGLSGAPVARS